MRVLYLSCFPDNEFKQKIQNGENVSQCAQKFNKLIVKGFCANGFDVDVIVFTTSENCKKESVFEEFFGRTVTYRYHSFSGNMIQKVFRKNSFAESFLTQWKAKHEDGIVVIDALNSCSYEFNKNAKRVGLKTCSIITDFPEYLKQNNLSFFGNVLYLLNKYKFYRGLALSNSLVLLTRPMLNKFKIRSRKYIVVDGICDIDLQNAQTEKKNNSDKITVLYSGAISKQFGLSNLVDGFLSANIFNAELHLYGSGDYVDELKEICEKSTQVKYFGTIPNEVMVQKQTEATFLVNPRPVGDEYTKYSFPSKNIEYMRSGRPLITTKLPCITEEYNPYVLFFDDDTANGISSSLKRYAQMDADELYDLGQRAQKFILDEKNFAVQAKKISDMLR